MTGRGYAHHRDEALRLYEHWLVAIAKLDIHERKVVAMHGPAVAAQQLSGDGTTKDWKYRLLASDRDSTERKLLVELGMANLYAGGYGR